jgi:PilZ domain-containing protein
MRVMTERRSVPRTRVLRNAKLILDDRGTIVQCTLLDLTTGGARLSLASTYRTSESFELTFDNGRTRRPCRVIWRTDTGLGISFERAGR